MQETKIEIARLRMQHWLVPSFRKGRTIIQIIVVERENKLQLSQSRQEEIQEEQEVLQLE